ncbi:MAG: hypothetical protein NC206_04330 [Bacteroides sp.]|nr:hypothetical protein [Roseburia sp.]MCM1346291.1 hypothetical protein [Bacteroides sp.]MCM1420854.1 hypothetical protein [Bacteroides sp.]
MRENLLFTTRGWFYRIMLLFVLVCTGATSHATDLGALELGKTYDAPASFQAFTATFTAPKSGVLTCEGSLFNEVRPFTSETHETYVEHEWDYPSTTLTVKVTEGQTLYFYHSILFNPSSFKLSMPGEEGIVLEMLKASPEAGSFAPTAAGGMVTVYFNVPITFTAAPELYVGDTRLGTVSANVGGTTASVEIAASLVAAYDKNLVKEGDDLVIKFHVAAKNDTNVKSDFEVTYKCPAAIVHLKNTVHIPTSFLSYWVTNDMDGVLKLEFTGELSPAGGDAILGYGDVESTTGDYYTETVPFTTDGNILSIDLTGKLRTPDNMVPSGTNYGTMSLKIQNVKDVNGNIVYSEGQGTIGSYSYNFPYQLLSYDFDVEFTPAAGESLANTSEVEIWVRGENNLIYNGVKFTYVEDGVTKEVVTTDVTREVDGDEVTLTVAVPAEVVGKSNIEVSLNEIQSKDGQNIQISAKYDAFVITVDSPRENTMEVLEAGTIFRLHCNSDEVGYMEYEIHDLNAENPDEVIVKSYSWLTKQEDGSWEAEVFGSYKLYKNHDYAVIFTAYTSEDAKRYGEGSLGSDTYIIHGATMPYINSDYEFVSMTPNEETGFASENDNVITLTFDGLVLLEPETTFINEGMGMSTAFESIVAVDPTEGYSNTWKLTIPTTYFAGKDGIAISFVAYDMDGKRLNGNDGRTGENAYFYYDIPCTFAIPDFTVIAPADGEELKSLSEITVGYAGGIGQSYISSEQINVYSMNREVVATVVGFESIIPEEEKENEDYAAKEMKLTLDQPVDKDGAYYILFPEKFFILGTQFESWFSKQTIVNFAIDNPQEVPATDIAVTDNGDGRLLLTFDEKYAPMANWACAEKVVITDANNNVVGEYGDTAFEFDWNVTNILYFDAKLTEAGVYTISFPEGFFILNDNEDTSTAATVTYEIEEIPTIANGTYYLKNVESGLYLTAANAWGTQASLGINGLDLVLTQLENGKYTIDSNIPTAADKHFVGTGGFMDEVAAEWSFVYAGHGAFNITLDGAKYIGYDGTTVLNRELTDATSAATQWVLVTKEELLAELASASKENPVNATFLITGQGFTRADNNRNNAWQGGPALGGDNTNYCAEKYNTTFDVYQTLTDIPNGIYEVSVQGFYRNGTNAIASAAHNAGTEELLAVLYANAETTPLMSVYAESKETSEGGWGTETEAGYVPNSMTNASNVFTAGAYADNKLQVIVTDGTLTIGIKKETKADADWTIFDNFELTYLGEVKAEEFIVNTPTEDTMEVLAAGTIFNVTVNNETVGYMEYEIHDLNATDPDQEIIKSYSWLTKQEDGTWEAEVFGSYKLIEGHDYAVIFTAYTSEDDKRYGGQAVAVYEHILHGASAEYKNSDLEMISISPTFAQGFESADDNVVTFGFSGLVKLESNTTFINLGMGASMPFASIEAVDPTEDGYATTWKLTVPESAFNGAEYIDVSCVAFDTEGRRLNGNDGRTGETAYFYYSFPCTFAIPDFAVTPADGAELESLSEITVSYAGGIGQSYVSGEQIHVYAMNREIVATVVGFEPIISEEQQGDEDATATKMKLILDQPVENEGAYYIMFPAKFFILGTQFESWFSKQTIVNFAIEGNQEAEPTEIAVTDNGNGRLLLTFDEKYAPNTNWQCSEKVVITDADNNVVGEYDDTAFEWDWNVTNILYFNANLTEAGTYTISFPEGFFILNDNEDPSTAVNVTYVVEGEEPEPTIAYLKNVESGLYLTAANSWGTQASLGAHGLDLIITQLANGKYTIDTNLANGDKHYLGDGFMDAALTEWTFFEVEEGVYNITLDTLNYIGSDGTSVLAYNLTDVTSAAAQWVLVTKEDLLAEMNAATENNPVDATFLISGQGFNRNDTNRNNAWEGEPAINGDNTNFCAEKFNTDFNVYQTLTDVPNGYYLVSVQGFYRNGGYAAAATAHNAGTEELNAMLYANNESTPLMSIFADSKETAEGGWSTETEAGYVPNSMTNASNVFTAGAYTNELLVRVEDGTLTIGIQKETTTDQDWTIFDNFELSYLGTEVVAIGGIKTDGAGVDADNFAVYSLTGVLVKANANKADLKNLPAGIYIVNGKKYLVK